VSESNGRWGRLAMTLIAVVATGCGWNAVATAAEGEPPAKVAADDQERVFVSGVADRFEATRQAIADAKRTSGRDYRVVVVDTAGDAGDAKTLLTRIVDRWRESADGAESGFDPSADVTILLAIKDRLLAMLVPWGLEVGSGLDELTLENELISKAFVPKAKDGLYDDGVAALVTATEDWVATRRDEELARVEAARVFRTRTLPLGAAGLAAAGMLGGMAVQWSRHQSRLRRAREKLAAFKADVVALSDLLDGQQERHRMLPHMDPDFKTPMQGLTRSAYDGVQMAIRRYRERWLSLMDVWEKAQARIGEEWFLGTAAADDAIRLLESAEARPPLADVAGECRAPLDALEQAHERARELAVAVDASLASARTKLEGLVGRGRSDAAYQGTLAAVGRARELAGQDVERDPVAARGRLEEAGATLVKLVDHVAAVEAADVRRRAAAERTAEAAALVAAKRAEGWLLTEPGANPDDRLAASRQADGLAAQLLDAGETDAALTHIDHAEKATAEAVTLVENIVAARAKTEDLLPSCAARLSALGGRREQSARAIEHLAANYAEKCWVDVAENVAKAEEGLARARSLIEEAQAAVDSVRQHYFRGVALLEEAVRQEDWIEACHAAVTDRRAELDQLLASVPGRIDAGRQRVTALERRLHRQQTDRLRANERCREAGRLIEVAGTTIAAVRPDPRQAMQLAQAADDAAARAEQLADEDDRLATQAAGEVEEADAVIRRVAAWYGEGVQADVRGGVAALEAARSQLERQRYEEAIKSAGEAAQTARTAYAAATAEAERRRIRRQQEVQRRQMEDSFSRMSRGAGPWVIQLPGGVFTGPDPWRAPHAAPPTTQSSPSRTASAGWSRDVAQVRW
jgi:hypothetical protein